MIRGIFIIAIAVSAAPTACSVASKNERNPFDAWKGTHSSWDTTTVRSPATIPILARYEPIALYEILPVVASRADYSGITIRSEDSSGVTVWLCNDKPARVEDAIFRLSLRFSAARSAEPLPVTPERLPVANPRHLASGEDIEDLGWIPAAADSPGVLAVVGERGPEDEGVSWFYLMTQKGDSLELIRSERGSPPGESVGNDGLEGVAIRRLDGGRVETFRLKERPAPTYILRDLFQWDGANYASIGGSDSAAITTMTSQSGASIPPTGDRLNVVDRATRRIAAVDLNGSRAGAPWSNLDGRVVEWIDYIDLDGVLEGRSGDSPPSLYGAVEGIAEDRAGRLYLMTDNNESRNSRLLVLRRK